MRAKDENGISSATVAPNGHKLKGKSPNVLYYNFFNKIKKELPIRLTRNCRDPVIDCEIVIALCGIESQALSLIFPNFGYSSIQFSNVGVSCSIN